MQQVLNPGAPDHVSGLLTPINYLNNRSTNVAATVLSDDLTNRAGAQDYQGAAMMMPYLRMINNGNHQSIPPSQTKVEMTRNDPIPPQQTNEQLIAARALPPL